MKWFMQAHSADADSKVLDWLRLYGGATVITGLVGFGVCIWRGQSTDWIATYGASFGALLLMVAGGQALRRDREATPGE